MTNLLWQALKLPQMQVSRIQRVSHNAATGSKDLSMTAGVMQQSWKIISC